MGQTKIPKTIHYIWLGTRPLDKVSNKCIDSWKKHLPDYKIVRWGDEECADIIAGNIYAREAYEAKKYAFVSDYLRVYILYNFGGIYMDTDVQIYKSLDVFLNDDVFTCFESNDYIPTALMAGEKGNPWIKMLLDDYAKRRFILEDGSMDLTTNCETITRLSLEWGLELGGREQVLQSGVHIYTKDYFCPLDTSASKNDVFTENTYAAHLYNGSWRSPVRRKLSKIKKKFGINLEKALGKKIYKIIRRI